MINKIKETFNERIKIINPKDVEAPKSKSLGDAFVILRDYFFPIIKKCDIFAYSTNKNGNITFGVKKELEYARSIGINIVNLCERNPLSLQAWDESNK